MTVIKVFKQATSLANS